MRSCEITANALDCAVLDDMRGCSRAAAKAVRFWASVALQVAGSTLSTPVPTKRDARFKLGENAPKAK